MRSTLVIDRDGLFRNLSSSGTLESSRKYRPTLKLDSVRSYVGLKAAISRKLENVLRITFSPPLIEEKSRDMEHIFISYQHEHQDAAVKLCETLKSYGYTTWIDEDNMVGSVVDSMAEAVENASVVIMCMSESYNQSDNCKNEIEYAMRKKTPIIPISFEDDHSPYGWLGLASGSKMVIDFSDQNKFDAKFQRLLKELAAKGVEPDAVESSTRTYDEDDDDDEDDD